MKKKIYFIISAILQMMASANLIASSNEVLEKTKNSISEVYSAFPIEFQNRIINMLNSSGIYYIIVPAIICIIINAIILILAFANKIVKKRGLLIFLSIMCIILSSSTVAMLLAIVNFILLLSIKKEEREMVKEEKKKLPVVKKKKSTKIDLICAAVIFFAYFSQFVLDRLIPDDKSFLSILLVVSFYVTIFVLVFLLFGDKIVDDFKKLMKNFSAYIEYDLPKYGLMIISFVVVNLITILVTKNASSVNQAAAESLPKLLLAGLGVIWAPIVEETVFRGAIRKYIDTDTLFIVLSALVFGFLHAAGEASLVNIIFTTLPYATLGGWLAYIYTKTDNLANNILIHAIWNLFAVIVSFFVAIIL